MFTVSIRRLPNTPDGMFVHEVATSDRDVPVQFLASSLYRSYEAAMVYLRERLMVAVPEIDPPQEG